MKSFRATQILLAVVACLTFSAGAYAVWAEYSSFPPRFRGFAELTRDGEVAGWAVDSARPGALIEVQLYVDGRFAGHAAASLPRPDVRAAGRASDENCGYRFELPPLPAGEHEARVYALHTPGAGGLRTLRQLGHALRFRTGDDGRAGTPAR